MPGPMPPIPPPLRRASGMRLLLRRGLRPFLFRIVHRTIPDAAQAALVVNAASVGVRGVGFYYFLTLLGVDATPLLTLLGLSGAAIGLAAKDLAANLMSGASIAAANTFQKGDLITIGNFKGRFLTMDIRYIYLETDSGDLVHVPNNTAITSTVIVAKAAARKAEELAEDVALISGSKKVAHKTGTETAAASASASPSSSSSMDALGAAPTVAAAFSSSTSSSIPLDPRTQNLYDRFYYNGDIIEDGTTLLSDVWKAVGRISGTASGTTAATTAATPGAVGVASSTAANNTTTATHLRHTNKRRSTISFFGLVWLAMELAGVAVILSSVALSGAFAYFFATTDATTDVVTPLVLAEDTAATTVAAPAAAASSSSPAKAVVENTTGADTSSSEKKLSDKLRQRAVVASARMANAFTTSFAPAAALIATLVVSDDIATTEQKQKQKE